MAGNRLRDAALLFNASRAIARQHLRIRQDQLDAWTKTSTVGKAVKSQTDRVTLTAQAASALAQRLNEQAPFPSPTQTKTRPTAHHGMSGQEIPRQEMVTDSLDLKQPPDGFDQDHHYGRSGQNSTRDTPSAAELNPEQKKAAGTSLPDGTLLPPDTPAQAQADSTLDEPPPGVDINVFRSPRGKRLLDTSPQATSARLYQGSQPEATPAASQQATPVPNVPDQEIHSLAADIAGDTSPAAGEAHATAEQPHQMHESRVPSSRLGRIWQYSGLATSMAFGAVGEGLRRVTGSGSAGGSLMLSAGNMERLVSKLSRMRGAALKLGQMISFQGRPKPPECDCSSAVGLI